MPLDYILKCCWRWFVDGSSWTRVRFPNGGLFCVVRDVQELPQEPCSYLISKSPRGNSPSVPPLSKRIFLFLLFPLHCKGENSFLSTVASSPKQCCPAGLTVLPAFSWLQVLLGVGAVTPAWHQEPNHSLLAPPELEFKRSLVCSHDVDRDSGWNGWVYVGFSIFTACFTPSNLCSLLWFKRIMSNTKSTQLSRR